MDVYQHSTYSMAQHFNAHTLHTQCGETWRGRGERLGAELTAQEDASACEPVLGDLQPVAS